MRIAIVEDMVADSHHLINMLNNYCLNHPAFSDETPLITVFKDLEHFQKGFLNTMFDLVFLDIYLSSQDNGYDIARRIRNGKHNPTTSIIFTTSSREYAVESYEVDALGYLLKPITPQALSKCLSRMHTSKEKELRSINILTNRSYIKVPIENISYVVANGNGSSVICKNNVTILTSMTVDALNKEIASEDFVMAKRGHLVNLNQVDYANEDSFVMTDGKQIPLKVKGAKELLRQYTEFKIKRAQ